MKKTQKERLEELFQLIKDNPELPIIPIVVRIGGGGGMNDGAVKHI